MGEGAVFGNRPLHKFTRMGCNPCVVTFGHFQKAALRLGHERREGSIGTGESGRTYQLQDQVVVRSSNPLHLSAPPRSPT
jgi:hypothetical protein